MYVSWKMGACRVVNGTISQHFNPYYVGLLYSLLLENLKIVLLNTFLVGN